MKESKKVLRNMCGDGEEAERNPSRLHSQKCVCGLSCFFVVLFMIGSRHDSGVYVMDYALFPT